MTQWEYDTILMALDGGVPALADKLGLALQNLVNERNKFAEDNEKLKKEVESLKADKCCCGEADCSCEKAEAQDEEKVVKKAVSKKVN